MTIAEMRTLLGLGDEVSDADVVEAYIAYLQGALPGEEPVTLDEIKLHLDVARDDQDEMLGSMIMAAREWVENYTGLILVKRTVSQAFDSFGAVCDLYAWPVAAGSSVIVEYADSTGAEQAIADARLNTLRRPARVYPAFGASWPTAFNGSVSVTVEAGYATPADVPYALKAAIKIMVADFYANRESNIVGATLASTGAVESLCAPYRMMIV